jgi:hypothetical protein
LFARETSVREILCERRIAGHQRSQAGAQDYNRTPALIRRKFGILGTVHTDWRQISGSNQVFILQAA